MGIISFQRCDIEGYKNFQLNKAIGHLSNLEFSEMRVIIALIFITMLSSLATTDEEEEKVLRRTRDGNVVKTGCEELDSFINNLSDFTNKIVNMFYDGKKEMHMKETDSESEDDTDEPMHLDL